MKMSIIVWTANDVKRSTALATSTRYPRSRLQVSLISLEVPLTKEFSLYSQLGKTRQKAQVVEAVAQQQHHVSLEIQSERSPVRNSIASN